MREWARRMCWLTLVAVVVAIAGLPRNDGDTPPTHEEFRYTADGWVAVSDLVVVSHETWSGGVERISPVTVATMQLLLALLVLLIFDRGSGAQREQARPGHTEVTVQRAAETIGVELA